MDYTSRYTGPEIDARLELAGEAYQKPATGIPASDLAEAVQTDLAKAVTAVQPATLATGLAKKQDKAVFFAGDLYNPLGIKLGQKLSTLRIEAKEHSTKETWAILYISTTTDASYVNVLALEGRSNVYFNIASKDADRWLLIDNATEEEITLDWYITTLIGERPDIRIQLVDGWEDHTITPYTGAVSLATEAQVATKYTKPQGGIPYSDMSSSVKESLGKADTAVQLEDFSDAMSAKQDKATDFEVESGNYLRIAKVDGVLYHLAWSLENTDIYSLGYVTTEKVVLLYQGDEDFTIYSDDSYYYIHTADTGTMYVTPIVGSISNVEVVDDLPEEAEVYTPYVSYYKPADGIPASDLASGVQTSLGKADTAYQKPSGGIPASDLASAVQTSLGKADSSVQPAALQAVTDLIPAQASPSNQLADKNFVNSSIQTETATFRGNYDTYDDVPTDVTGLPGEAADNNDYLVVRDASGYAPKWTAEKEDGYSVGDIVYDNGDGGLHVCIQAVNYPEPEEAESPETDTEHWAVTTSNPAYEGTWRYKYVPSESSYNKYNWLPEYQVNEKPLTAAQLAAINSGITDTKVGKLDALPTRAELTQEEALKEDKTNKVTSLSSESTDTQYPSAKCVYDIVGDIETLLAAI